MNDNILKQKLEEFLIYHLFGLLNDNNKDILINVLLDKKEQLININDNEEFKQFILINLNNTFDEYTKNIIVEVLSNSKIELKEYLNKEYML